MNDRQSIAALLERTSRVLEGRLTPPQIDYIFDPHDDMSLREVIELLKYFGYRHQVTNTFILISHNY
jgi:hypothetical protein